MSKDFYVITGGPGGGKTTLIDQLKFKGYTCVEEGARQIIQQQMRIGGEALPWANIQLYKELLLTHARNSYEQALKSRDRVTFFDRGILDLVAYDRRTKTESSSSLLSAIEEMLYNNIVFITPPWEAIFCTDNERKQTYEEAIEVYNGLVAVYEEYGCRLVELPKVGVAERMQFVLNHIN